MPEQTKFPSLIDNAMGNTVVALLKRLLPEAAAWDVAASTFEIGQLLALEGAWQAVKKIRVLFGDETSKPSRRELQDTLRRQSDDSIEAFKQRDDATTLAGLEAVRQALQTRALLLRGYAHARFDARAQRLEFQDQPPGYALVGSSSFSENGMGRPVALNLGTTDADQLAAIKDWFQKLWLEADDVTGLLLAVVERHLRLFTPFEIWAKALYEYCEGREVPVTEWEEKQSVVFPLLSKYQQDGYRQARAIADNRHGALLCDGTGLGKTYIGAMLLEYHLHRGQRILLLVPRSARSVWESRREDDPMHKIRKRYPRAFRDLVEIRNHTDFGREGTVSEEDLEYYREFAEVVIVDEAHHFRTPGSNRSQVLRRLCEAGLEKQLYFLTATPINNSLRDLYHLINYVARDRQDYFADLGIQNLSRYFTQLEQQVEASLQPDNGEADIQTAVQDRDLLRSDHLLKALVIQRSRAYVVASEKDRPTAPIFPDRSEKPQVVKYSLKKVYADLYGELRAAFHRDEPLLSLAIYNPEEFRKKKDSERLNRDKQIVGLIRTLLLKRLESSYKAFESSLENLLRKMAAFLQTMAPVQWEQWHEQYAEAWGKVQEHYNERRGEEDPEAEEEEGNELEDIELPEFTGDLADYDLDAMVAAVEEDMNLLAGLLTNVYERLSPATDDKLLQLVQRLRKDPRLKGQKVVIFTEFRDTARYLLHQLRDEHAFNDVEELDSSRKINRETVIKRFAPYYNCTARELPEYAAEQIRVLISTDVLSEGLNLQDASRIINYDLHWNPVRLMQRIGRIDRRLNPDVEAQLGRSVKPPVKVHVFNFLLEELSDLLGLYQRITGKLLRISKTLGIEAPVLTPEDDFEAVRLFNERYEGRQSTEEKLQRELDRLRQEHPKLYAELPEFPRRAFSARQAGAGGTRGLFCAYRFPPPREGALGELRWYLRVAATGAVWEAQQLAEIAEAIRSVPETPQANPATAEELKEWRQAIERDKVVPHLRALQAPVGVKAVLVCWMDVC